MSIPELGFIIQRHVNNTTSNNYWKQCYSSIRKLYPDDPILIIDDNSNMEYVTDISSDTTEVSASLKMTPNSSELASTPLHNCNIIYHTTDKGAAELLPYKYFHELKPFKKAVIVHDGIIINSRLDIDMNNDIPYVQGFWSFRHCFDNDIRNHIEEFIKSFHDSKQGQLGDFYYNHRDEWTGFYGAMSIIDWEFLNGMVLQFNLFERFLPIIVKNKCYRCAFERIFGLLCSYYCKSGVFPPLFGDVHDFGNYGITYSEYIQNPDHFKSVPIIKVCGGR